MSPPPPPMAVEASPEPLQFTDDEEVVEGGSPGASRGGSPGARYSLQSQCSIVSGKSGREARFDRHGNPIEKGTGKKHRPSFVDQVDPGSPVKEVVQVIAYKHIVYDDGAVKKQQQPSGCGCVVS